MAAMLFLGVEGGATRTTGVLADEAMQPLAEHAAGPTNVHAVGRDRARDALAEIVQTLRRQSGARWDELAGAALCVAGIRAPSDRDVWRGIVESVPLGGPVLLTHDAAAGLAAGCDDETGILVVCGTGSVVYGRRGDGAERFVGGRGPILGDEGSGFDIGRRGLRAAIRSADGRGPATRLEQLIPDRLGLGGLEDLVAWASPFAKDRIAGVAPIVFSAAADGDGVAEEIVRGAAGELARGAAVVAEALWPVGSDRPRPLTVVLSGGVLRRQEGFRERVSLAVGELVAEASCVVPAVSGALGAARIARRRARPPRTPPGP